MKKKSISNKLKYALLSSVSAIALTVGFLCSQGEHLPKPEKVFPPADTILTDFNPLVSVYYKTDTLDHYVSALLYYSQGQITRNFVEKNNIFRIQLPYFSHEFWHHHNKAIPYYSYRLSPSQRVKACMHEEISANLAAILTVDLKYQAVDDKMSVIKKYEKTYMGFYFDAIKNAMIDPCTKDSVELDKKYSFLINGTINIWQNIYRSHYSPSLFAALNSSVNAVGLRKSYPQNYKKILSHMYTFGGVDFSKYIKEDAYFPDVRLKVLDEMAYVKSFMKSKQESAFLANEVFKNFDSLKYVSPNLRDVALQHLIISAKLKYELTKLDKYKVHPSSSIVSVAYNKVMYELSHDVSFANFIDKCHDIGLPFFLINNDAFRNIGFDYVHNIELKPSDQKIISSFYNNNGVSLLPYIKDFDANVLPLDKDRWTQFAINYFTCPPLEKIIEEEAATDDKHEFSNKEQVISRDIQNKKVSIKQDKSTTPIVRRRLSKDIQIDLLDLTKPILVLDNLPKKQRLAIIKYFHDFDNIDEVFKGCDTQAIIEYMKKHKVAHPFKEIDEVSDKNNKMITTANLPKQPLATTLKKKSIENGK